MSLAGPDRQIASTLGEVNGVEQVFVTNQGSLLQVLTIVDEDTDDICNAIYDLERRLIRQFSSTRFDFNVVARHGKNVSDIVGDLAPAWQRHDSCLIAPAI